MVKMYLELGKKIKSNLTPECGADGINRIDIVINKKELADEDAEEKVELVKNVRKRVTCIVRTDKKGNEHLVATLPTARDQTSDNSGEVIFRTIHGKLRKYPHSFTAHFSFDRSEKNIADTIEDEVSDMAEYLCERLA